MPPRSREKDWEHYFGPNAPRRGGPLRALVNLIFFGLAVGLLGFGAYVGITYRDQLQVQEQSRATAAVNQAATFAVQDTATAIARAATATARSATRAPTLPPTTAAALGRGIVITEANLRSEPRVADQTRLGLLAAGDQVVFLERQERDGQVWFRIQVSAGAAQRPDGAVPVGTTGWASATVLSAPQPE